MEYNPFGESTVRYKLADPFCIFYLNHVRGNTDNSSYWQTHEKSPSVISFVHSCSFLFQAENIRVFYKIRY